MSYYCKIEKEIVIKGRGKACCSSTTTTSDCWAGVDCKVTGILCFVKPKQVQVLFWKPKYGQLA